MELEIKQAERTSIFQAISDLLEWLARVWAPLGAFIFAVASIYWLEFIRVYAIPVSFASSSVLTGLPAMAAAITAIVGALTIFVLMPAALLWLPIGKAGKTLMDGHQSWQTQHGPLRTGVRRLRDWGLLGRWIAGQIAIGLLWVTVIAIGTLVKNFNIGIIVIPATLAATFGYWWLLGPIRRRACDTTSLDFGMMFCVLTEAQFLVVFGVIYIILQTAPDSSLSTLGVRAFSFFMVLTVLSLAQLTVAKLVSTGWYPNAPKHIVLALMVITALPTAFPPGAAAVTAFALHTADNNGKSCVILLALDAANPKIWHDILDTGKSDRTVPLYFAVRLEDTYYVKQTKTAPTYSIPVSQTTRVVSCPANQPNV
jgi:hypothetical protein